MAIRTCVLALLLLAVAAPVSAQRKPAPEAEVCKNCHADYVQTYFETKHGQVGNVKGPTARPATATPMPTSRRAAARAPAASSGSTTKPCPQTASQGSA